MGILILAKCCYCFSTFFFKEVHQLRAEVCQRCRRFTTVSLRSSMRLIGQVIDHREFCNCLFSSHECSLPLIKHENLLVKLLLFDIRRQISKTGGYRAVQLCSCSQLLLFSNDAPECNINWSQIAEFCVFYSLHKMHFQLPILSSENLTTRGSKNETSLSISIFDQVTKTT